MMRELKPALNQKGLRPDIEETLSLSVETCPESEGIATPNQKYSRSKISSALKPALNQKGLRLVITPHLRLGAPTIWVETCPESEGIATPSSLLLRLSALEFPVETCPESEGIATRGPPIVISSLFC